MNASVIGLALPTTEETDSDDVRWALETAGTLWAQQDFRGALRWLARAAETAAQEENDRRSLTLARAAADLRGRLNLLPTIPPPVSNASAGNTSAPLAGASAANGTASPAGVTGPSGVTGVASGAEFGKSIAEPLPAGDLSQGDLSQGDLSQGDLSQGDLSQGDLSTASGSELGEEDTSKGAELFPSDPHVLGAASHSLDSSAITTETPIDHSLLASSQAEVVAYVGVNHGVGTVPYGDETERTLIGISPVQGSEPETPAPDSERRARSYAAGTSLYAVRVAFGGLSNDGSLRVRKLADGEVTGEGEHLALLVSLEPGLDLSLL